MHCLWLFSLQCCWKAGEHILQIDSWAFLGFPCDASIHSWELERVWRNATCSGSVELRWTEHRTKYSNLDSWCSPKASWNNLSRLPNRVGAADPVAKGHRHCPEADRKGDLKLVVDAPLRIHHVDYPPGAPSRMMYNGAPCGNILCCGPSHIPSVLYTQGMLLQLSLLSLRSPVSSQSMLLPTSSRYDWNVGTIPLVTGATDMDITKWFQDGMHRVVPLRFYISCACGWTAMNPTRIQARCDAPWQTSFWTFPIVLQGYLIPIINKTFIKLNTAAYPIFTLSFLLLSWDSTSCPSGKSALNTNLDSQLLRKPTFRYVLQKETIPP
jgi:hypothetical protein